MFRGADTDQLRDVAAGLASLATDLETLVSSVVQRGRALDWTGADADDFRDGLIRMSRGAAADLLDSLDDAVRTLRRNAEEQDDTSQTLGGGGSWGGQFLRGGRLPIGLDRLGPSIERVEMYEFGSGADGELFGIGVEAGRRRTFRLEHLSDGTVRVIEADRTNGGASLGVGYAAKLGVNDEHYGAAADAGVSGGFQMGSGHTRTFADERAALLYVAGSSAAGSLGPALGDMVNNGLAHLTGGAWESHELAGGTYGSGSAEALQITDGGRASFGQEAELGARVNNDGSMSTILRVEADADAAAQLPWFKTQTAELGAAAEIEIKGGPGHPLEAVITMTARAQDTEIVSTSSILLSDLPPETANELARGALSGRELSALAASHAVTRVTEFERASNSVELGITGTPIGGNVSAERTTLVPVSQTVYNGAFRLGAN